MAAAACCHGRIAEHGGLTAKLTAQESRSQIGCNVHVPSSHYPLHIELSDRTLSPVAFGLSAPTLVPDFSLTHCFTSDRRETLPSTH